jgi:hypothetical protein
MSAIDSRIRSVIDQDGAVLLDIGRDEFFSLNPIGAAIWKGLENGQTPQQIKSAIVIATGMGMDTVSEDVDTFIEELRQRNLIHL